MRYHLILLLLVVFAVTSVSARPDFVTMDVDGVGNKPLNFGYMVSAERRGDKVFFELTLDRVASTAFKSATILFYTPVEHQPSIPIMIYTAGGKKRLNFAIPFEQLSHCVLKNNSDSLRAKDLVANFSEYRLRLDNVLHE